MGERKSSIWEGSATIGDAAERQQVLNVENDWVVAISVDDPEGRTRATARLQFGGRTWVGDGLSRLGPAERGVAGAGGSWPSRAHCLIWRAT
jgi:hypothetical protein